jgi:uncharacterized protein
MTRQTGMTRRRWSVLILTLCVLSLSCAKLARRKLEKRDLGFDADTFVSVVAEGAVSDVKLFLQAGMSPNVEGRLENAQRDISPLMAAAQACHSEIAELLRDAGADPKYVAAPKESLLHAAADGCANAPAEKARKFVEMLVTGGAEVDALDEHGESALIRAIEKRNVGVVAVLVERGAKLRQWDRRGRSLVQLSSDEGNETSDNKRRLAKIARILGAARMRERAKIASFSPAEARNYLGSTPYKFERESMINAAAANDVEALQVFFVLDAPPDWYASALARAVETRQRESIALLIQKGVKPETDALLAAIQAGEIAQVRMIVKSGLNLNAESRTGATPLIAAARRGWFEAVQILLESGAAPNQKDSGGTTPLQAALSSPTMGVDARTVSLLLARGAEVNVENSSWHSPAFMAASGGNADVLQTLVDAGAIVHSRPGRDSVLHAALGSQANHVQKEATLSVLYAVVDGWSETEKLEHANSELSMIMQRTAVRGFGVSAGNRSARVTIGGSGPLDRVQEHQLVALCHDVAGVLGLGCCWLDRIEAYPVSGGRLGEFRFDRTRGWSFVPAH